MDLDAPPTAKELYYGYAHTSEYNEGNIHSEARGTTARCNAGKVRLSLVPLHLLTGCARVLEAGLKKYAPWNWAKGGKWSTPMDALLRHLLKWWFCREEYDPESGEHHLDHAMANLMFLIHYNKTYRDGDDRPDRAQNSFWNSIHDFDSKDDNETS